MRVTQQEVAEQAGVTRATVSYVLNGRAEELKITDQVVRRVKKAARDLGYTPSHAARALVSGKSMTLGLLVGGPSADVSPFWSLVAEGVESEALKAGYDVLLISGERDRDLAGLRYLRQGRVDALIALGGPPGNRGAEAWQDAPTPPIVVHFCPLEGLPRVDLDAAPGLRAAVEHLVELGHRDIVWIGPGRREKWKGGDRLPIVREAAGEMGATIKVLKVRPDQIPGERGISAEIEGWRRALERELPDPLPGTGAMCWNDPLALGLYGVLQERGVGVPEDLSVVGFDNHVADCALPPLSTVSFEFRRLGAAATRLALEIAEEGLSTEEARQTVRTVPSRFVPRESTGPVD